MANGYWLSVKFDYSGAVKTQEIIPFYGSMEKLWESEVGIRGRASIFVAGVLIEHPYAPNFSFITGRCWNIIFESHDRFRKFIENDNRTTGQIK